MSPAAGPTSPSDREPMMMPAVVPQQAAAAAGVIPPMAEIAAKDAIIAWYRGEFAAANAIIDALCNHLTQLSSTSDGPSAEYEAMFAAMHRRRLNWIPVLQMQKYFSIADVALELRKVAEKKKNDWIGGDKDAAKREKQDALYQVEKAENENLGMSKEQEAINDGTDTEREVAEEDSPDSEITDAGSQEAQATLEHTAICDNHKDCVARREQIKMTKGFVAKEPVKGHMVNVVKGLKMYEDVFAVSELCKLNDFVDELRAAGQNGELLGETYILFNKQMKGNKREQIQLGIPIFGQIKNEATNEQQKTNIEPIPALLQSVIDHLVQWQIIPENRKPNGCIINFFDEGEYSQPYLKPPHLDQPICILLLSESAMAFGRTLLNDNDGNSFKGQLSLSLRGGSLLVMRNNSADMARHVICPSPARRASITFFRVRRDTDESPSTALAPMTRAMATWQPGIPSGALNGYNVIPKWGIIRSPPMIMLAPVQPMVMDHPRRIHHKGGTGVFLPWAVGSSKPPRHLPPRAQKSRLLALPSTEAHVSGTISDPSVEGY
ncbi:hypothetical protein Nepgr_022329 [Nepenthes gracilis]|uniref:Fe2OG dioxygenase domain-containing protein n=1 Tax=Nepenthes gracilis TaxID=150966 RepID=A0AAD3XWV6_NEPGR|nr:hypothetical protein Nepgr_022329 [Nepenthes gracilis]